MGDVEYNKLEVKDISKKARAKERKKKLSKQQMLKQAGLLYWPCSRHKAIPTVHEYQNKCVVVIK